MKRSVVVTIRFTAKEMKTLEGYLRENVYFDSISSLGRVATLEFVRTSTALPLRPRTRPHDKTRLWFLWDYDLTEAQVQELLTHAPFEERKWLLGRMLERLGPEELVRYVSLKDVSQALPHLRLDEKIKRHWQEAIALWTQPSLRS